MYSVAVYVALQPQSQDWCYLNMAINCLMNTREDELFRTVLVGLQSPNPQVATTTVIHGRRNAGVGSKTGPNLAYFAYSMLHLGGEGASRRIP
jgi:hypothetical protein